MTNKPMLSVDRELLELVTNNKHIDKESISIMRWEALCKLRAILSNPASHEQGEPVAIIQVSQVDGWASAYTPRYAGRLIGVRFTSLDTSSLQDGQPLYADPDRPKIKLQCNVSNVRITVNEDGSYTIDPGEQPAPVAVVMPEHTMRSVMDAIQQARGFPVLTSNQCHALAESLNYVARLSGVKQ